MGDISYRSHSGAAVFFILQGVVQGTVVHFERGELLQLHLAAAAQLLNFLRHLRIVFAQYFQLNIRSLGFGAGMGLPNMKRYTDEMTIQSQVGKGTTITMIVYLK